MQDRFAICARLTWRPFSAMRAPPASAVRAATDRRGDALIDGSTGAERLTRGSARGGFLSPKRLLRPFCGRGRPSWRGDGTRAVERCLGRVLGPWNVTPILIFAGGMRSFIRFCIPSREKRCSGYGYVSCGKCRSRALWSGGGARAGGTFIESESRWRERFLALSGLSWSPGPDGLFMVDARGGSKHKVGGSPSGAPPPSPDRGAGRGERGWNPLRAVTPRPHV